MSEHKDQLQSKSLEETDPEIFALKRKEQRRQFECLELIASENFTSKAVLEALGSCFTNKYSEGYPGRRYYGGNEFIDEVELLAQQRALKAFHLNPEEWGVNVQPYSGSVANFGAYTALLRPHDRIMGLALPSGGHLTHGHYTDRKKISISSMYFESLPYEVSNETGLVDFDLLARDAMKFKPKLIIAGGSAYPRDWDYKRMRKIADSVGAYLMVDMAHYAGLVAAQCLANPFEHAHVVTTTTHKSLRGPRAAMIFFRKDKEFGFEGKVNFAVFPSMQGGPHDNKIAAIAVQMKEVASAEYKEYAEQVVKNSKAFAAALIKRGYNLVTGGSDTHLILWDLRPLKLTGSKMETLCDLVSITLNKNSIYGDKRAGTPGGVRVGTLALTSRGFKEEDFEHVAEFLHRAAQLAAELQKKSGPMLKDFKVVIAKDERVLELKKDVQAFASKFYMPAFDEAVRGREE